MHPLVRDLYKRFLVVSQPATQHLSVTLQRHPPSSLTYARVFGCGLLWQVARDYPLPADECKRRIREGFLRNSRLATTEDILRAVHHGRYKVRRATHQSL